MSSNNFPRQQFQGRFTDLIITTESVAKFLQDLDPNSGMGCDGVYSRIVKSLIAELSFPLATIFNSSLWSDILPDEWLSSLIVPFYKKSKYYDLLKYRPIRISKNFFYIAILLVSLLVNLPSLIRKVLQS